MFDFSFMIREFGIPLEIKMASGNDSGSYNDLGQWVTSTDTTKLDVIEPLIPYGSNSTQSMSMSMQAGGEVQLYSMYWYSEQPNIVLNTVVTNKRTGKQYKVANSSDYGDYSTVTIYGLEAVDNE